MILIMASTHWAVRIIVVAVFAGFLSGCATSINQVREWEQSGNIPKLSEVARNKTESPIIRKKALESLARLNWKPSNDERLQVYGMFASQPAYNEASKLMQEISAESFASIDEKIVACASLLTDSGNWMDISKARSLYNELRVLNSKAVIISLCQQVAARPHIQIKIILLAIKLGIQGSENELVGVLFQYGDKTMAEDYLNSGSATLADGGRKWAAARGYRISSGYGSHRSGWGRF